MANEITLSWTLIAAKGTFAPVNRRFSGQFDISASAPVASGPSQIIGTASGGEALSVTDLTANGFGYLANTDATNYVEVGIQNAGTFYPLLKLKPGESFPVRFATGITPYARANTAAVVLEYIILDN